MMRKRLLSGIALLLLIALSVQGWRLWSGQPQQVIRIEPTTLVQDVVAAGRVSTTSRAQIGVEITATVQERHVMEGDHVSAGQMLLTLKSDEQQARMAEAQAALENLRVSRYSQALVALEQSEIDLAQAQREAQRKEKLFRANSISIELLEKAKQSVASADAHMQQTKLAAQALAPGATEERILIERVQAAGAALEKTRIRAQFEGLVLSRNVEPGDLVQPGRVLFEIARLDDAEILVPVDERHLGTLQVGQMATCIADAFPFVSFTAKVDFISPMIDRQRGTVDVRLKINQAPAFLKEDMTVTATITTAHIEQALLVPNSALRQVHAQNATVMVLRHGKAVERTIKTGLRGLMQTQVIEGLASGDLVLVDPQVQQGQRVQAIHVD